MNLRDVLREYTYNGLRDGCSKSAKVIYVGTNRKRKRIMQRPAGDQQ